MKTTPTQKVFAYIGICISILIWSYSFVWYNEAFRTYSPLTIITIRVVTVVIFMGIIYGIYRPSFRFHKKDYKYLTLISLFEPCLYFVGESHALKEMSATTVSLLQNIFPVFLPAIILLFKVEKIKPIAITGFISSLTGVYMLYYSRLPMWDVTLKGMMYLLLCTGSILFYPVLIKKLSSKYPISHILFIQYVMGALFLLLVCLFYIQQDEYLSLVNLEQITPIIKLSFFASLIACLFYLNAIRRLGVLVAVLWMNIIPLITFLIESFQLQSSLDTVSFWGLLMTVTGILSISIMRNKENKVIAEK